MNDYLVKALAFDGEIRAFAVNATETVREAQRRHKTASSSTAALGRALTGGLMLGAMSKGEDKLTIKINGNGPAGVIMIDSNGKGEVKGYIDNPNLGYNELGEIDVRNAIGIDGTLSVIKDLGLKEPFIGQVPLVSGELGEDFTYYLANSEQVPSSVGLCVLIDEENNITSAGGFMIQVMPDASEKTLIELENKFRAIPTLSKLLSEEKTPEEILYALLDQENVKVLENMPVQFKCDCSKERFSAGIMSLGKAELQAMIDEDRGAEVTCHFCENTYNYSEKDLQNLIEEIERAR